MYQYALFDLDGTLTDPKEGITKSVQYALHALGIEETNLDKLEPFIGPPLADSFREFYGFDDAKCEEAITKYRERFEAIGLFENVIYEGIPAMLRVLQEKGMKLAIASSKPTVFVRKILIHFEIDELFDVVVGSELDGRRGRKEEVVEEALKQLYGGTTDDIDKKHRTVMIGDRRFDVEGAKAYGIDSIGVKFGYAARGELKKAGATYLVKTVEELQTLLLNENLVGKNNADNRNLGIEISSLKRAWYILYPLVLYYVVSKCCLYLTFFLLQNGCSVIGGNVAQWVYDHMEFCNVILNGAAMIVAAAFIKKPLMAQLQNAGSKVRKKYKKSDYIWVPLLAISASFFLNILFSMIQLTYASDRYNNVAKTQYCVPIWVGVILYGIIAPVVEESVFRGLIYNRMKEHFPILVSIIVSGIIFGAYHGNIVQGFYGGILGILLAICYEVYGNFLVPIVFHSIANLGIYILSYNHTFKQQMISPLNCVIFSTIAIICLIFIRKLSKS